MNRLGLLLFAMVLAPAAPTQAADTTEPLNRGDAEGVFVLGVDGPSGDRSFMSDFGFGYGFLERLTGYAGSTTSSTSFSDTELGVYAGLMGTPIDTDHFDLDLFLDACTNGDGLAYWELGSGVELNLDAQPDTSSYGVYLRLLAARIRADIEEGADSVFQIVLNPGVYWTIADGHQLLLEYDTAYVPSPDGAGRVWERGGLAFGYNIELGARLELVTETYVALGQRGERSNLGVAVGLIAAMPSLMGIP